MTPRVAVVDYGVGNVASVARALEACGASVELISTPALISKADRLVLPGVGAFRSCVKALEELGLFWAIREALYSERPVLGICVGMQLLFEESEEFGTTPGFCKVPGKVLKLERASPRGDIRLPFVGWSALTPPESSATWEQSLLSGLPPRTSVYFVHSYAGRPAEISWRLAETDYGAGPVCAAVSDGTVHGVQFHPERSGPAGLRILQNFVAQ